MFWLAWVSGPVGATLAFGIFSFLALREFITLAPTRRSDHRSLILAFFVVLPLQYVLVGLRSFDLFSVFIPVYVFLAIPVLSALAGDPERFLERNEKIQWGITVCVFGLSHAPALLLLALQIRGPYGFRHGAIDLRHAHSRPPAIMHPWPDAPEAGIMPARTACIGGGVMARRKVIFEDTLAAIRGAGQLAERKLPPADKKLARMITDEVDRIARLIDRMQQLGSTRMPIRHGAV